MQRKIVLQPIHSPAPWFLVSMLVVGMTIGTPERAMADEATLLPNAKEQSWTAYFVPSGQAVQVQARSVETASTTGQSASILQFDPRQAPTGTSGIVFRPQKTLRVQNVGALKSLRLEGWGLDRLGPDGRIGGILLSNDNGQSSFIYIDSDIVDQVETARITLEIGNPDYIREVMTSDRVAKPGLADYLPWIEFSGIYLSLPSPLPTSPILRLRVGELKIVFDRAAYL